MCMICYLDFGIISVLHGRCACFEDNLRPCIRVFCYERQFVGCIESRCYVVCEFSTVCSRLTCSRKSRICVKVVPVDEGNIGTAVMAFVKGTWMDHVRRGAATWVATQDVGLFTIPDTSVSGDLPPHSFATKTYHTTSFSRR